jgi:hypothetical protein
MEADGDEDGMRQLPDPFDEAIATLAALVRSGRHDQRPGGYQQYCGEVSLHAARFLWLVLAIPFPRAMSRSFCSGWRRLWSR